MKWKYTYCMLKLKLLPLYVWSLTLPASATLIFDFDDGTLQGWEVVGPAPSGTTFGVTSETAGGFPVGTSGSFRLGPMPWTARDGAHDLFLLRSPEFILDGSGDLTVDMIAGQGGGTTQAVMPSLPSDLAPTTADAGVHAMGFGLRRVSDDSYVLTLQRSVNDASWSSSSITAVELAPYVGAGSYTLDYFDSYAGGWGWTGADTIVIPATQVPEPSSLACFLGGLLWLTLRRKG